MSNFNENKRSKLSRTGSNHQVHEFEELDRHNLPYRSERSRERRDALANTRVKSANGSTSCQKYSNHQLAERVRELQREIAPDLRRYQLSPVYSPFTAVTPCSNISTGGIPTYPNRQSFSINLTSPNSSVPTQRFGLSSRIIERAHQIPERFWIEWQQKQMQTQIEELEYIKNNLTSPNKMNPSTTARRKSLLLLHNAQHQFSLPQSTILNRSIDNDLSSSLSSDEYSSCSFDQRSLGDDNTINLADLNKISPVPITPNPSVQKSQSTLDRSRLTIFLPNAYTNNRRQSFSTSILEKSNDVLPTISAASSVEDVAQIDTELNLTLLSRENHPLLYSKATINRTVEFRPLKSNENKTFHSPSIYQKDASIDEDVEI